MQQTDKIQIREFRPEDNKKAHGVVMIAYTEVPRQMARYWCKHPLFLVPALALLFFMHWISQSLLITAILTLLSPFVLYHILLKFLFSREIHNLPDCKNLLPFWKLPNVLWIAERSSQVVGSVGIEHKSEKVAELIRMNVLREYRGIGLGRRLLEHCLRECRARGYTTVWLGTSYFQEPAISLYKKFGFKLDRTVHRKFLGVITLFKVYVFILNLSEED